MEDHLKLMAADQKETYQQQHKDFIELVRSCENDGQVLAACKAHDAQHSTDFTEEAIYFTIYCIACHRVDCVC